MHIDKPLVREYESCSMHFHKLKGGGNAIYYIVIRYQEDSYSSKKGDVKTLYVWESNEWPYYLLEHIDENFPFCGYIDEASVLDLSIIKDLEPILVGQYQHWDFYFRPELMTGTPTDETCSTDFVEALEIFKEISRIVYGIPIWDK